MRKIVNLNIGSKIDYFQLQKDSENIQKIFEFLHIIKNENSTKIVKLYFGAKIDYFQMQKVLKILEKATKFYYFGTKNQKVDLRFFVKVKFFWRKIQRS